MPAKEKAISESAVNFKEKADKILRNYQNIKNRYQNAQELSRDRYRLAQVTHFDQTKINDIKPVQKQEKVKSNRSKSALEEESQLP